IMKRKILIGTLAVFAFMVVFLSITLNFSESNTIEDENILAIKDSYAQGFGDCWQTVACSSGGGYCSLDYDAGKQWVNLKLNFCAEGLKP
ncbi:MAG: hypothetical protein ACQESQ_12980, partial [Bacteroidota bacterium]